MDTYEPPLSLWEIIKANTGAVELDEIRLVLGPADVDLSQDLHLEVNSLLEIWRMMCTGSATTVSRLAQNADVRRSLVAEIKIFVDSIREKTEVSEMPHFEQVTSRPVVKQALAEFDRSYSYRPSSSIGSDGRDTPSGIPSPARSTSRTSSQYSLDDIVQMKDRFKINRVSEIVQHLRGYLSEEIAQLKDDAVYLRNCIEEDNALLVPTSRSDQPSIAELRCERNRVEAEAKWATENAALLRPMPSPKKRYGGLDPIFTQSPPPTDSSCARESSQLTSMDLLDESNNLHHSNPTTPSPDCLSASFSSPSPQPPQPSAVSNRLQANLRVVSAACNKPGGLTRLKLATDSVLKPKPTTQELLTSNSCVMTLKRPPLPPSSRKSVAKSTSIDKSQ